MSKMKWMVLKRGSAKYFLNVEHIVCFTFTGGETIVRMINDKTITVDENSFEIEARLKELAIADGDK